MNRIAVTAAVAVMLASLSMSSVIASAGWIAAGAGAVAVVVIAGALTRLARMPSAVAATFAVLIALVPLLTRPGWADRTAALVILVITALSATGARLLRAFATLACYLAALLVYVNLTFAHAASLGYLIPTDSSMSSLAQLWRLAFIEFRYAPPVADTAAVSLVTSVGIGAVAIAVDILAVRLRRPAVAGLPLLLLFSVPVASNLKVFGVPQMIVFAAGLAGYLALLSADGRQRLRMWGRLVTFRHVQSADETGTGPDTSELSASGRRIGLAAVCLAIAIPAILPAMHPHDVFATAADSGGSGGGGTAGVSPLLKVQGLLLGKSQPVLSYTTTAKDPGEQYFQVYVVYFSNRENRWLLPAFGVSRPVISDLPWTVPGVTRPTPVTHVTTTVSISGDDTGQAVLPVPYAPTRLQADGDWRETAGSLMVFSQNASLADLHYTVHSEEADPQAAQIPDEQPPANLEAEYGTYNGPDHQQLYDIAADHTSNAASELQEALDLQKWFLSGAFRYSLKPGLANSNWLMRFLTSDRRGYCSQFAQAFAILAMNLGIPARIAIGYTGGTAGAGNKWDVTTADAHAWPELYFTGEGWLRFEPTPSGSRGQGTAEVPVYAAGSAGGSSPVSNLPSHPTQTGQGSFPTASRKHLGVNRDVHAQYDSGGVAGQATGSDSGLLAIVIPLALLVLVASPALIRLLTRRRRWLVAAGDAAVAHAAWAELTDDLTDYGLAPAPGETPRALARRVTSQAQLGEPAAQAMRTVAAAEERARYARLPESGAGLKAAVISVRRSVAASVPRRQRTRAKLLPASTLLAAKHLIQRGNEMLGWLDSSWPTARRQVRRPTANRSA